MIKAALFVLLVMLGGFILAWLTQRWADQREYENWVDELNAEFNEDK